MDVVTKHYTDGTRATGVPPLPDLSPQQQEKSGPLNWLNDMEVLMGGPNGPSLRLRAFLENVQGQNRNSFCPYCGSNLIEQTEEA